MKLPYSLRGNQKEIIESIKSTLEDRNHIVLESPTGSGKTFASLAGALDIALDKNLRIVYCVRTNSQQDQVIQELKQFNKVGHSIKAVALQGRDSLCPQQKVDSELKKSNWSEKSKMCTDLKKQVERKEAGCPFYRKFPRNRSSLIQKWSSELRSAQDFSLIR